MVLCYFYIVPTFLPVQAVIAIVVTILWIGPLLPILLLCLGTWGGGDPHSCFISSCNIGGFLKSWSVGGTGSHSSCHQDLRVHLRMQQMENRQRTEVQRKTHLGFWIKPCLHSVHLWAFHLYEPINALFFFWSFATERIRTNTDDSLFGFFPYEKRSSKEPWETWTATFIHLHAQPSVPSLSSCCCLVSYLC